MIWLNGVDNANPFPLVDNQISGSNCSVEAPFQCGWCTVLAFGQDFALEDAIGSHACSIEANMRVTNGIPLGSPPLIVTIINYVETLKGMGQFQERAASPSTNSGAAMQRWARLTLAFSDRGGKVPAFCSMDSATKP
jgi:hypothetical protein